MDAVVVLSTFPDRQKALDVSNAMVAAGEAACASMMPVDSIFVWEGRMQNEREWLVLFKTTAARAPSLEEGIERLHPYDVPEIARIPAGMNPPYLAWLASSCKGVP